MTYLKGVEMNGLCLEYPCDVLPAHLGSLVVRTPDEAYLNEEPSEVRFPLFLAFLFGRR